MVGTNQDLAAGQGAQERRPGHPPHIFVMQRRRHAGDMRDLGDVDGVVRVAADAQPVGTDVGADAAEHHAIAAAVLAEGPTLRLKAVAIAAHDAEGRAVPIPPCGGCRQKLMEFSDALQVVFLDASGGIAVHALADLLPGSFELPAAAGFSVEPASR